MTKFPVLEMQGIRKEYKATDSFHVRFKIQNIFNF